MEIILRKAAVTDTEAIWRNVWRHPETARYMLWNVTGSMEDAAVRMAKTIAFQQTHDGFFVCLKQSNEAIGFAGLKEVEPGVFEESGIALGPQFTRKGYGKQVVSLLLDIARQKGGRKFIYSAREQNTASIALAKSMGFSFSHTEPREDPRDGSAYTLFVFTRTI